MYDFENGILPIQYLSGLIDQGIVAPILPINVKQLQPASLDLRLGYKAYLIRASFLPRPNHTVEERLGQLLLHEIDLTKSAVLDPGCVYIVPLLESLNLPLKVSASTNPKSSTGRLDVFTRVICDGINAFDCIPAGYNGPLFAEICPQTFPIKVRTGSSVCQIRFRIGSCMETDNDLKLLHTHETLVMGGMQTDISNGISLSVNLSEELSESSGGLVGYRAKRNTTCIDIDKPASCSISNFWEPIYADSSNCFVLDPDQFYILASKEAVHIPPSHAAEIIPFNPSVGEFRVHYAGFIDPGFGHGVSQSNGTKVVLEVRSHKVPFILEDGQIIGRLVFERMHARPDVLYGKELGSHYYNQALKLSKHFV